VDASIALIDRWSIDMESFLRFPAVLAKTGLSRSTIYLKISRGEFPAPVKLGQRAVGWPETAIARWIAARIDAKSPTD
jgi:prophage regulatory protein